MKPKHNVGDEVCIKSCGKETLMCVTAIITETITNKLGTKQHIFYEGYNVKNPLITYSRVTEFECW